MIELTTIDNNIPQTIKNLSHHGRRIDAHNTFLHQLMTSVRLSVINRGKPVQFAQDNRKHRQLPGCADNRAPCMFCILSRRPQYIKPCRHGKLQILCDNAQQLRANMSHHHDSWFRTQTHFVHTSGHVMATRTMYDTTE